ncbi:MAG: 2-dehydropantoate 2-reductase [Candidatus Omnitrophica bacterium]|jgi:2-dehydropantoate 2-reductase|nr:2-dehydropantoate 2-reductase [Candidatus Omnitrophota bacterium]
MKIVIVGSGAMGCLFAAGLVKTKEEIWILDKNAQSARALNQNGILVEGSTTTKIPIKASANIQEIGLVDLAIICVKSFHTKQAIIQLKPAITKNSKILTLQNGIGNIEVIAELLGEDKVIGGSTSEAAIWLDTGKIRHTGKGETVIGMIDGKTPVEMRSIREILNKAGFSTKMSRDIKGLLWSKLIINVGINALSALTGLPSGKLIEIEASKKILRESVTEAVRIVKRKRIKLIYDDPLAKVEAVCEATAENFSSMLQDVLRKKHTEIDYINGVIVRLGQELSIPVPVNTLLVNLIKSKEASYAENNQ